MRNESFCAIARFSRATLVHSLARSFASHCNWTHSMQCLRTEVLLLSGIIDKSSRIKVEHTKCITCARSRASRENKFKLKTSPSFRQISLCEVNESQKSTPTGYRYVNVRFSLRLFCIAWVQCSMTGCNHVEKEKSSLCKDRKRMWRSIWLNIFIVTKTSLACFFLFWRVQLIFTTWLLTDNVKLLF